MLYAFSINQDLFQNGTLYQSRKLMHLVDTAKSYINLQSGVLRQSASHLLDKTTYLQFKQTPPTLSTRMHFKTCSYGHSF